MLTLIARVANCNMWRIWAKALGEKASSDDREADRIAWIRTAIIACYVITNMFIVAGVIRHW
jgi:hypothetical protein